MEQLKINDIFEFVNILQKQGMNYKDIMALPIYLGKDDELNGIHTGWCINLVDSKSQEEDNKYFTEMINEDYANNKLTDKGILIS